MSAAQNSADYCRQVELVDSLDSWTVAYQKLKHSLESCCAIVGLDCEWLASELWTHVIQDEAFACSYPMLHANASKNGVASLQLATLDGCVIVLRLCCFAMLPESLVSLLENCNVIKVGININEDASRLFRSWNVVLVSYLDIRYLCMQCPQFMAHLTAKNKDNAGISLGLKTLADELLGVKLNKNSKIACSNWNAPVLAKDQIQYAAEDAWASIQTFAALYKLCFPGIDVGSQDNFFGIKQSVEPYLDKTFKTKGTPKKDKVAEVGATRPPVDEKLQRFKANFTKKGLQYHNCQLQAPNGTPLALIDLKKVEWYLANKLASPVEGHCGAIRLHFEPRRRPEGSELFYIEPKENKCVVCGSEQSLVRKNIIPHQYRKYFPLWLKSHKGHDIVLLCAPCHYKSAQYDMALQKTLATHCAAPMDQQRQMQDRDLVVVKRAVTALLNERNQLPDERRAELQKIVAPYTDDSSLKDALHRLAKLDILRSNDAYVCHGEKVVAYMSNQAKGVLGFERLWRQHFLDCMKPKYMPALWSVSHKEDTYATLR